MLDSLNSELVTPTAAIQRRLHGNRAKCLQRLIRLDMPVPDTVALSIPTVAAIAAGQRIDMDELLAHFGSWPILSVRSSPVEPDWGGPGTVLNIGMNRATEAYLASRLGSDAAAALHLKFIRTYAVEVARLDDDLFDAPDLTVDRALTAYEDEMEEPFPRTSRPSFTACSNPWRGPGTAPPRGCCACPRARPKTPGLALLCSAWRWHGQGRKRGRGDPVHQLGHRQAQGNRALSAPVARPCRADPRR